MTKSFQDQLTAARERANLTQHDVAALLDISQGTISNWEAGRGCPSKPMQKAALNALKSKLTTSPATTAAGLLNRKGK